MPDTLAHPLVTKHAQKRLAERLGCGRKGAERAARIARERGTKHAEATGALRRYLDRKAVLAPDSVFIAHGAFLFIFAQEGQLITVHALPRSLRPTGRV